MCQKAGLFCVGESLRGDQTMKKKKIFIILIIALVCIAVAGVASVFGVNGYVKRVGGEGIISPEKATELKDVDCILVLGCKVTDDGNPSHMLSDRIKRGIELYEQGAAPKIIMSGDHGRIAKFRRRQQEQLTRERRPDMWENFMSQTEKEV